MAIQLPAKFRKAWTGLAAVWAVVAVVLLCWSYLSSSFSPGILPEVYWLAVTLLTPVTFAAFGWDKWKAKRESQRIPEKTLYLLSLLGGWPGAVLGQNLFRHKTIKSRFRAILSVIVWIHLVISGIALWQRIAA